MTIICWEFFFLTWKFFSFQSYVENNHFGNMTHINQNDPKYKILFEGCHNSCDVSYYTIARMKMKNKM